MQLETERKPVPALRDLITSEFPNICELKRSDDREILQFFDHCGMGGGGFKLQMKRAPYFWNLFDHRGGETTVLGLRGADGALIGTGAMTATDCYIGGRPGRNMYMADLRIMCPDHLIRKQWKQMFAKIMEAGPRLQEANGNGYLSCVIIETNAKALKALKEKVHNGQKLVRLTSYSMITLFRRWPWRRKVTDKRFVVERGGNADEIENFLGSVAREQAFGMPFGAPHFELRRRLKTWVGLSINDFFSVRDGETGKIVATTALWNPNPCKQTVVEGPWWTKPFNWIARMVNFPEFGKPLQIQYLTHLHFAWELSEADRRKVFSILVDHVWPEKSKRGAQGMAYCDFTDYTLRPAVKGFGKAAVHVGMYIILPQELAETFDRSTLGKFPPAFELAMV